MSGSSIIIPTYNRAELLRNALKSLQALRIPVGWEAEILVIDNNSTDHTPAVTEEFTGNGQIEVRRVLEKKPGLSHVRNRGLEEARFDHLIYLDDDMTVAPEWLDGYVEALRALRPDCVVGPVEPEFEGPPPPWMTPEMIRSVTSAYSQKGDSVILVDKRHAHELPGCNFAVRRRVALELGGFHPDLGRSGNGMLGGEDWEFGNRLALLGKRVVYSPRCRIRHLVSRKKISRDGLRRRWEGNGATAGALMKLRGEQLAFHRRARLLARMTRFHGRSLRYHLGNDMKGALQWELQALWLKGFLFNVPPGLKART